MEIKIVSNLAKASLNEPDYNRFIERIENKQLNSARLFIEDKLENFNGKKKSIKFKALSKLDNIITNEVINQIEVNGYKKISK